MNPSVLTVYKSPYEKKRIGRLNDGGYVICDISNIEYSILLAGGIESDISFEEAFLNKYPNVICNAYDGTINAKFPITTKNITYINKNITHENTENSTNLLDIIDTYDNIFVKMDIEGSEVAWINSLKYEHLNKFSQIVIEFHLPFSMKEQQMFEKLNSTHVLVHLHPNNGGGVRMHRGLIMADIFECTYVHKKYFNNQPELSNDYIPKSIDMDNCPYNPRIYMNYPPFVDLK